MYIRTNKKEQTILLLCSALFFILRFPIGRDINNYIYFLTSYPTTPTFGTGRFFFIDFYYSLSHTLTDNPKYFLFLTNFICVGLIFYCIYKYSKNYALSAFIFATSGYAQVYLNSGIRQAMAMAVLLFAFYKFLVNDNYVRYALCILLVATYHDSALLMLLLIPLKMYKDFFNNKIILLLISLSLAIGLIFIPLITPYLSFIGWYYEYISQYSISLLGFGLQLIQFVIVCVLYKYSTANNPIKRFVFIVNAASFSIYLLMVGFPLVSRICDFIQIVNIIYIPYLLVNIHSTRIKTLLLLPIVLVNLVLLYFDINDNISALNPNLNITIISYPYKDFITFDPSTLKEFYNA